MELKDIFKMEMFKNSNDRSYLIVIAILTGMAAAASLSSVMSTGFMIKLPLIVFTILGLGIFSLLYPFHLLNTDYKNRVMSLIFASGVSREKYYFVKIGATILTCFIAMFIILFVPILFSFFYPNFFVGIMQGLIEKIEILPAILGFLAYIITLTTSVIITKGKISGIFLFFGFLFLLSIIQSTILFSVVVPLLEKGGNESLFYHFSSAFSIVQIVLFVLISLFVLRRQDL